MSNTPQLAPAGPIVIEGKHEGIATLVMNRPDRLNALNGELSMAINDALGRLAQDQSVNVVVITGAGRAFCAGGDLAPIGKRPHSPQTQTLAPVLPPSIQIVLT